MIRPAQVLGPPAFGGRSLLSGCSVLNPVSVKIVRFDEVPRASKRPRGTRAQRRGCAQDPEAAAAVAARQGTPG